MSAALCNTSTVADILRCSTSLGLSLQMGCNLTVPVYKEPVSFCDPTHYTITGRLEV